MPEPAASGLLGTLGLNGKLFIAQLVNFSVVVFVVWRWVYRPLLALMDAREKKIAEGLANADKAKLALAESEREREELIRSARLEARDLVEAARTAAEEERKRLMAQTQSDLERQLAEAKERLKQEKETTLKQARGEVAALVVEALEKTAPKAVDAERTQELVREAIANL